MKTKKIFLIFLFLLENSTSFTYNDEAYVSIDEEEYAIPSACRGYCGENSFREKRMSDSPMKSRVIDAMLSTRILPLRPDEPDVFSFLRDQYELPKGEYAFSIKQSKSSQVLMLSAVVAEA